MIDLHTHTIFSDGGLIPSELVCRAETLGYRAIAITDHVDISNADFVVSGIVKFCREFDSGSIKAIPGAELTHVPPGQYAQLTKLCRDLGAKVVVAHGETIVEPVADGTNRAAINAGVDIIAHPGLLNDRDAALAAAKGVALEISGRGGHCFANGHVVAMSRKHGSPLVFNTDTHQPRDLMRRQDATEVAFGAGMTQDEVEAMFEFSAGLVERLG